MGKTTSMFGRFQKHVKNVQYSRVTVPGTQIPTGGNVSAVTPHMVTSGAALSGSWASCSTSLLSVEGWAESNYVSKYQLVLAEDRIQELEMIVEMLESNNGNT